MRVSLDFEPVRVNLNHEPVRINLGNNPVRVNLAFEPTRIELFTQSDFESLKVFDGNGAAIAGGLEAGELYRTPSNKVMVVKKSNIILNFGDRFSLIWRAFW